MSRKPSPTVRAFAPPPGLTNSHLQSILSRAPWRRRLVSGRAAELLAAAGPQILDCGGGVRLLGYYSPPPGAGRDLAVLLHGWEGSAASIYMLSAGTALRNAGFGVFRLNFRDHGNTQALNRELFHSCRIDEVVNAIKAVQARYRPGRLFLAGHSLGGNFAVRVAARAPAAGIDVERVLAVCPVLQPHSTMRALERGLFVYRGYFLRRWRASLLAKAATFPELYDFGDLTRFRTLTATTDFFVRRYTEFPDLDAYLSGYALTGPVLENLSVPTRMILAADDPVIPARDLDRIAVTPSLRVDLIRRGGHCGFVEGLSLTSWVDAEVAHEFG
jgi:hypothetical protein